MKLLDAVIIDKITVLINMNTTVNIIEKLINDIDILLYISMFSFIISTCILIRSVKKTNYDLVKNAVTNPFFPNIDLSFFSQLQNECKKNNKNKISVIVNKISFYSAFIGFIVYFILIIVEQFIIYGKIGRL